MTLQAGRFFPGPVLVSVYHTATSGIVEPDEVILPITVVFFYLPCGKASWLCGSQRRYELNGSVVF